MILAKAFRFRLETVLRLRKYAERDSKLQVAAGVRRENECREEIERVSRALGDEAETHRRVLGSVTPDVVMLDRAVAFMRYLEHSRIQRQQSLKELERGTEDARGKLVEASRAVKVVEKLRERQWNRHVRDEARREAVLADEVALDVFRRTEPRP